MCGIAVCSDHPNAFGGGKKKKSGKYSATVLQNGNKYFHSVVQLGYVLEIFGKLNIIQKMEQLEKTVGCTFAAGIYHQRVSVHLKYGPQM